ncbi:MAG: phosphatidylserine decarboxylase [Cellvibrionales bacterium TMED47]|nr:phosphatidylserine decarboxylase [Porticoccaceae bacterium]RPG83925.1 MAG: phosphatidylserine decarboxylase [Cellvibrionales bacterium TMED47]|tara:strand:+ start:12781 stop:13638 length:858 start_codon:yes stop_codon:yes gene_type:complete
MNHRAELFVAVQRILPKHALSRLIARLAESQNQWLKNLLINRAIKTFHINMDEALNDDLSSYKSFNAFFTRQLKPELRPLDAGANTLTSPADGVISQAGKISKNKILQAKNVNYSLTRLVGNARQAKQYENGLFSTIYLSPKDYHRVHIPADGQLISTRYIPGELFSVNQQTAEMVPNLFARNERLVCEFKSQQLGHFSVIFVGAMLVAGIETVWSGMEKPGLGAIRENDYSDQAISFLKGDEIGRFKFGSTVIVLFPENAVTLDKNIKATNPINVSEKFGLINH